MDDGDLRELVFWEIHFPQSHTIGDPKVASFKPWLLIFVRNNLRIETKSFGTTVNHPVFAPNPVSYVFSWAARQLLDAVPIRPGKLSTWKAGHFQYDTNGLRF